MITLRGKPGKVGVFVSEPVSDGLDATTREVAADLDQLIERDQPTKALLSSTQRSSSRLKN